jgi:endonuclease/exonuclease/phosphatase family metal-dependent hydrolase
MLRLMTYNIENGGVDDDLTDRLPLIAAIVRDISPDILAVQEANEMELRSWRRFFAFERATGLRGVLGTVGSGFHGAFFLRPEIQIERLTNEDVPGNRSILELGVYLPSGRPLTLYGVHLDPVSPDLRLVGTMHATAAPPAVVLGDFNNLRGDDPGAARAFDEAEPRRRARAGTTKLDDRALDFLERAGYEDLYRRLHPGDAGHSIRPGGRLDYIFATADLASRAVHCEVMRTPESARASDHYPVWADIDIE